MTGSTFLTQSSFGQACLVKSLSTNTLASSTSHVSSTDNQKSIEENIEKSTSHKKFTTHDPVVVFKDAAVTRSGKVIWSQGTFEIPRGSISAIVGANGAGKTTLLKVELGQIPLSHGSVTVLGKPAGSVNKKIGYVPQDYAVDVDSNITGEQSVRLGILGASFGIHHITKQDKERMRQALEMTGIAQKAHLRLSEMSGGMKQRIAIAQALVSQPELLLLDEPLANLDLAGQRDLCQVLLKLNKELNVSIQIVAHDINILLPILTGAIYLLDGHPHYSAVDAVMDSDLLTHLYGTSVEVIKTPQGDLFVRPKSLDRYPAHETHADIPHIHTVKEVVDYHVSCEPDGTSHKDDNTCEDKTQCETLRETHDKTPTNNR